MLPAALLTGEQPTAQFAAAAAGAALLTGTIGDLAFRAGTAQATTPVLTAATQTGPLLALLWVHLAVGLSVREPWLAAAGAALIVGSNAAMSVGVTRRKGA